MKEEDGGEEGGDGRGGNSFANQALALRSISSCQRVPGVNKVISFNPALQLYITPSYREYSGLSIEQEFGGGQQSGCWLATRTPEDKSVHAECYRRRANSPCPQQHLSREAAVK